MAIITLKVSQQKTNIYWYQSYDVWLHPNTEQILVTYSLLFKHVICFT